MRKKKLSRRQFSIFIIFSLLLAIGGISLLGTDFSNFSLGKQLKILSQNNIPLREISGSFLLHDKKNGKDFVYTVGDASSEISISEIDLNNRKISNTYYIDIKKKILDRFGVCTTKDIKPCKRIYDYITKQWEALYVDPQKKIYLLNESLATIIVYDPKIENISHTINLSRFTLESDKKNTQSYMDTNSLGEGFLPLKNGHILVVKESFPPSLIEFGPKGEKSAGFKKEMLIDESNPFPFDKPRLKLDPLHIWSLPKDYKNCDLSELTYSEQTGLNLLSQKCQAILEIEDPNVSKKEMKVKNTYRLPRSVMKAEAFITLPRKGEFLVFEDKKSLADHNFYFLAKSPVKRNKK